MKFSKRITSMQSSLIRRLVPYAEAAKAEGKKVYHLNIGQPDIVTPPGFLESIKKFAGDVIAYSASHGSYELIDAMIDYYKGFDINLERKNLIVTNGGSEALSFALMATCDPGDEVLVPEPFYANYNAFASSVNVKLVPITTRAREGFHLPPKAEILKKITPLTRAILFSNPGNPTGVIYTREEMEMIADIALEKDIYVIADEVYREFVYDGLKIHQLRQHQEARGQGHHSRLHLQALQRLRGQDRLHPLQERRAHGPDHEACPGEALRTNPGAGGRRGTLQDPQVLS